MAVFLLIARNPAPVFQPALNGPETLQKPVGLQALERHYTVAQLSKLWFFSESTIRRLFIKEPGVIKIAHQPTRVRRGYTSLRIPERIAQRVHRRLQSIS